jgi:hypothetical protein
MGLFFLSLAVGASLASAEDERIIQEALAGPHREACASAEGVALVLVHDEGAEPAAWTGPGEGLVGLLEDEGFAPCAIYAPRLVAEGAAWPPLDRLVQPLQRYLERTRERAGADEVAVLAVGAGAALVHGALVQGALYDEVDAVAYLEGPFAGLPRCGSEACMGGDVLCCSLRPGSSFLARSMEPLEAPWALTAVPDQGRRGRLRYLCLGASAPTALEERGPASAGWMLDGAWNLHWPGLDTAGGLADPALAALLATYFGERTPRASGSAPDGDAQPGAPRGAGASASGSEGCGCAAHGGLGGVAWLCSLLLAPLVRRQRGEGSG